MKKKVIKNPVKKPSIKKQKVKSLPQKPIKFGENAYFVGRSTTG